MSSSEPITPASFDEFDRIATVDVQPHYFGGQLMRADLVIDVACPECGEATRAELDIASYLWTELDAWARDVLLDVHLLATAYGWSEPEILALSPTRRRYYLELCADV